MPARGTRNCFDGLIFATPSNYRLSLRIIRRLSLNRQREIHLTPITNIDTGMVCSDREPSDSAAAIRDLVNRLTVDRDNRIVARIPAFWPVT